MGISNTQYRDIMFQYDQTRMNNQRILDKRYETLFAEIPELEQIQHDIMDLSLTQARKELFQTEPDPKSEAEYSAKREALLSRKKALLLHHGYPEDYLQSADGYSDFSTLLPIMCGYLSEDVPLTAFLWSA